ncbi:MAG: flagellar biosynthetic protein FliO [Alkaliphilus sp.]
MQDYIFNIIIVLFVIGGAYYFTIFIVKRTSALMGNRNTKVIERVTIGHQHSIVIVQIGNKVYILSEHSKSVELLDSYSIAEWKEVNPDILTRNHDEEEKAINKQFPFFDSNAISKKVDSLLKKVRNRDR